MNEAPLLDAALAGIQRRHGSLIGRRRPGTARLELAAATRRLSRSLVERIPSYLHLHANRVLLRRRFSWLSHLLATRIATAGDASVVNIRFVSTP
jgi:hypothetical protein